ncbi:NAD(P)H-dependent oxidoreductase [Streptomyces sp. DG2A-72]|uniref:NADPH-dependent FMN reductase n=1 Tax=Streptomyces sp. DG2A-72 TaxID=3051386 RepID=UPI00265C6C43|nr:NAD(P)H-dependent oxidoreductase [Streptomyces sp. DG2A-72]MDO0937286.1 NAD(P)H-dependent oxidoreductase [Streptomyces sp. DG2A-72]
MTARHPTHPRSRLRIAVLVAGGRAQAARFARHAWRHGRADLDIVDLTAHTLPPALARHTGPELAALLAGTGLRLGRADAFVVVVSGRRRGIPETLGHLIDWHHTRWRAKPVGLVGWACRPGRAEPLREAFAGRRAVTLRDSFRTDAADADALVRQLGWWARALRAPAFERAAGPAPAGGGTRPAPAPGADPPPPAAFRGMSLPIPAAASLLGSSAEGVEYLIDAGRLPLDRATQHRLVPLTDVLALLRTQRV